MSDGRTLAIMGMVCLVLAGVALASAGFVGLTARDFNSAAQCDPGITDTHCLQRRAIQVTGTGTGRFGEINAVDFLDGNVAHESHLGFGRYDVSVVHPGASGIATLWHGQYTNLEVSGVDFLTDQNPGAWQGLWIALGVIGIGFALVLWAASVAWNVMNRAEDAAPH